MCVAAAIVGGSVVGGLISADANRSAANSAMRGQRDANALQGRLFDETKAEAQPFLKGGGSGFEALLRSYGLGQGQNGQADYSGFYDSPDYQFALQQGQNSLDRSAASRGRLHSGQQMKASQGFGQGLATQYLGNYRTGLQGIAGTGVNALNALSGARSLYGQQAGQGAVNMGNIGAASALGQGNILSGTLNNVVGQIPWGSDSGGGLSTGNGTWG